MPAIFILPLQQNSPVLSVVVIFSSNAADGFYIVINPIATVTTATTDMAMATMAATAVRENKRQAKPSTRLGEKSGLVL